MAARRKSVVPTKSGPRANGDIDVYQVRLIDEEGNQAGILKTAEALLKAEEIGLDLVEISPKAEPPVCRLMDLGKFHYAEAKKRQENRKRQTKIVVKEVKFRPGTDVGDYDIKLKKLFKFLGDGNRAKVTLRFRGREMAHQELGVEMLKRVEGDLAEISTVEQFPKMEGRQMVMVLAPKRA